MICRSLCLLALCAASLTVPAQAQIQENFQAAVDALDRGADEEALELFQKVLAEDPSHQDAYELWQRTDNRVWLKMVTRGGELEMVFKALMEKARMGRKERANDPDKIRELVKGLATNDVLTRTKIVNQLASDYGEYAVPIMVHSLADADDSDRRVNVMQALTHMGSDVVPPLIEGLDAPDAFLRRNVALTLGYISDPRAKPALARLSANDEDPAVRNAALQCLQRMGGSSDPGALQLAQGDAYYREDDSVLMPHQYSDVIWHWEGTGLAPTEVPRFLYAPEMAKKAYYRALETLGEPGPALAGIARCAVTELGRLAEWQAAGQDVGDWAERLKTDDLAAQLAGPTALDLALGWALQQDDQIAASGLCRLLARSGNAPTANLQQALSGSKSGAVRGEAAVALGSIAFRTRSAASPDTVAALAEAASVEVVRIGAVIDGDDARRRALVAKLTEQGMLVNSWSTGGRGLGALQTIPGIDVLIVADRLPDMLLKQVIDYVRENPRTARVPILVIQSSPGTDEIDYGAEVKGVITPGGDLIAPVEAALSEGEGMNRDRQEANVLAARAAETLYTLAAGGRTDASSAAEALAGTLASRPDAIVLPALGALEFLGGTGHVERVAAVLTNPERTEEVRERAANCLAGIFSRTGSAEGGVLKMLQDTALKDASFAVRGATAGALGRLNLSRDVRVELMRGLRGR